MSRLLRVPFKEPIEFADKAVVVTAGNSNAKASGLVDDRFGERDDGDWFSDATKQLLPTKPGTCLHFLTGFEERTCQRYAAGSVRPPAYFLRALLRSPQGWTWLSATMDGSNVEWWRDQQAAFEYFAVLEAKRREIEGRK